MIKRIFTLFIFCFLSTCFALWANRLDDIRAKLFNPQSKSVLVASHRGDWRNACENSLEAIEMQFRWEWILWKWTLPVPKTGI